MTPLPDNPTLLTTLVRHYEDLVDHVRRRFSGRAFARDVVHDLCVQLLERPSRTTARQPLALLRRASLYRAIDRQRAEASHATIIAQAETHFADAAQTIGPQEQLLWRQQFDLIRQAIDSLPPRCQQVFLLHRLHDMPQADIAEALGISRNMVARHVMRAMSTLRPLLDFGTGRGASEDPPAQAHEVSRASSAIRPTHFPDEKTS
ncbi:RNA polymerase sigma factor [Cupriavidus pauculus]|uniref:Transcriptional regulator n=1 Tax=Cupriavidus pauculus TaxID=82633 RepID=A0A2N5CC78_9BURK|nr:RNA polymerase sigma factor [Cupriavidus pauculus]PLP99808.1 transcriptional regulator [Cupriavidus pauculus]